MSQSLGQVMLAEIREQPSVFERVLQSQTNIEVVARAIRRFQPQMVLFTARGTSDNAATYARYACEVDVGLPTGLMAPSTMTLYDARPDLSRAVVVAISQSGGSPDLCEVARRSRELGALVVAATNTSESPLAHESDFTLDVMAGPERAVAATKSYSAQLLTLRLLMDAIAETSTEGLEWIVDAAYAAVSLEDKWRDSADFFTDANRLVVTGRGYHFATALETALKIMETSYLPAQAFSAADLLHGPMAMVDGDTHALALCPDGLANDAMRPVIQRLRATTPKLLVAGGRECKDEPLLRIVHGLPEKLSPIIDIISLQFLAWQMAVSRGHNPDAPRGLSKVTKTL